jgi:hypothetical protein
LRSIRKKDYSRPEGAYFALMLITYSAFEDSSVTSIRQSQPGRNFPSKLCRI